jgi:hypothetical protein
MATVKVLSQNLSKGTSENHRTQDFLRFENGGWEIVIYSIYGK